MSLIRKIITVGNSRAVVIPGFFLEYFKSQGKKTDKVDMEIDSEVIVIKPIFEEIGGLQK